MRNVRDLGELTAMTMLPRTPMSVTMLVFLCCLRYTPSGRGPRLYSGCPRSCCP
ncbi:hypothetical protein ACFSQ7_43595 [Paenibacillus rhizoplanae]